jgi:hypothetical protein
MIRVKTRVFLAMKIERVSLQNKHDVIQPFITAKKQNKTENKSKDAPIKTHIIQSNKNIVS